MKSQMLEKSPHDDCRYMSCTFKFAYPDKLNDWIEEQLAVGKFLEMLGCRDCPKEQSVDIQFCPRKGTLPQT